MTVCCWGGYPPCWGYPCWWTSGAPASTSLPISQVSKNDKSVGAVRHVAWKVWEKLLPVLQVVRWVSIDDEGWWTEIPHMNYLSANENDFWIFYVCIFFVTACKGWIISILNYVTIKSIVFTEKSFSTTFAQPDKDKKTIQSRKAKLQAAKNKKNLLSQWLSKVVVPGYCGGYCCCCVYAMLTWPSPVVHD